MNKLIPLKALLLCAVVTPVAAHQFEAMVNYAATETEVSNGISPDSDTNRVLVGGKYYFSSLNYDNGPLALADFFGRNSNINMSYSKGEFETSGSDYDLSAYTAGGRYVDADSGWLVNANLSKTNIDTNPDTDTSSYTVSAGKYFAPTSTISLGYGRIDDDNNGDSSVFTLSNFHAQAVGNDRYFDGGVAISYVDREKGDNGYIFNLSTKYYPTQAIGFGIAGSYSDVNDSDTFTYSASAEWFIAEEFAINGMFVKTETNARSFDLDTETFQIGARLRF